MANYLSSGFGGGGGGGGGSGLPPFVPEQFAVLMENPAGVAVFARLTEDMILDEFLITSLVIAPPTTQEIGDSKTNPAFTVAYNRLAAAATIDDGSGPIALFSPFTNITIVDVYTETAINASQVFTLLANETGGPTKQALVSLLWQPRVYFGVAVPAAYTEAFIEALPSNALDNNRQRSISVTSGVGTKIYYGFPAVYGGAPSNFIDAGTGFAAGFTKIAAAVSVTNAFGVTNPYDLWESDQFALGTVTINVT